MFIYIYTCDYCIHVSVYDCIWIFPNQRTHLWIFEFSIIFCVNVFSIGGYIISQLVSCNSFLLACILRNFGSNPNQWGDVQ